MTIRNKNYFKNKFVTNYKIKQEDYTDWLDTSIFTEQTSAFELNLGAPSGDDYVLTSKIDGTKTWIEKWPSAVTTVNGSGGDVVLTAESISAIPVGGAISSINGYTTTTVSLTASDVGAIATGDAVTSFNSQKGDLTVTTTSLDGIAINNLVNSAYPSTNLDISTMIIGQGDGIHYNHIYPFHPVDGTEILRLDYFSCVDYLPIIIANVSVSAVFTLDPTNGGTDSARLINDHPTLVLAHGSWITIVKLHEQFKVISSNVPEYIDSVSHTLFKNVKNPTGFLDGDELDVFYDYNERTITVSGADLRYYFEGIEYNLSASGSWTSSPSPSGEGLYFLYTTDGENFIWSEDAWEIYYMQVSVVRRSASAEHSFALRETHNTMDWRSHNIWHRTTGTILLSGCEASSFAYEGTVDDDNCPIFGSGNVIDEDLITAIDTWQEPTYTICYLDANNDNIFDLTSTLPFSFSPTGSNYIQWNNVLTGELIEGAEDKYYNVHQIIVPVAKDANSQSYRMIFLAPQKEYSTLTSALNENPRKIIFGNHLNPFECLLHTRITYHTLISLGTSGHCNIPNNAISYIKGSKLNPIIVTEFDFADHSALGNLSWVDSNHEAATRSVAGFDNLGDAIIYDISGSSTTIVVSGSPILDAKADLIGGKVPVSQIPGDVLTYLEVSAVSALPETGELTTVYFITSTNESYRWSGSDYRLSASSIIIGETANDAYRGDHGLAAYLHSQTISGNPHQVTYIDVGAAPSNQGVTNGNLHDHNGGDGGQIDHTHLSNIGLNSHSTIDSHISSTSNPHSVTKTQVGLSDVDNTSDADKPISNAVSLALDDKVNNTTTVAGHPLTSNVTLDKSDVGLGNVENISITGAVELKVDKTITVNTYPLSANVTLTKFDIGLENVENVSITAADELKVDKTITVNSYPLSANVTLTKSDIGLGNVENVSITAADALKVDKTTTINTYPLSANITLDKTDIGLGNVTNNAQYYSGGQIIPVTDGGIGVGTITGIMKGTGTTAVVSAVPLVDYELPHLFGQVTGTNATTTTQTLTTITGLTLSLGANSVYHFEVQIQNRSTSNAGNQYALAYTGSATVAGTVFGNTTLTAFKSERLTTLGVNTGAFPTTLNADTHLRIVGVITTTTAGTLSVQHLKVTSGTATAYIGSFIKGSKIS
jgi:hypothetical protein